MFQCEKCGNLSLLKEKRHMVIVGKRQQTYYKFVIERHKREFLILSTPNKDLIQEYIEQGWKLLGKKVSKGWEIEKEIAVCTNCLPKPIEEK